MTWHKEHMTGTEGFKARPSCEPLGSHLVPMATLVHCTSRLGNFPRIGIPWRLVQALSSPQSSDPDGRQTDDRLPKIISLTHCAYVYTRRPLTMPASYEVWDSRRTVVDLLARR